ncbi:phage tail assembly protein [Acinetobacter sp. c3-l95]|uniref:phage tail assembly protein n=1 Tax=Acinetobacter sp. c3-l95 TaxID=3342804 RepID=UPI0035B97BB9
MPKQNAKPVSEVIQLQHPFTTAAGVPIEQIHIKQINVRQMKQAQRAGAGDDAEVETAMVAIACDLVVEDLDEMMMSDYAVVRERFQQLNFSRANKAVAETTGTTG